MTKLEKRVNLLAVAIPFAATLAAIVLLWNSVVRPTDLAILAVMYLLTGLGVTVGFHRLLTHRSFLAPKPVEYTFAVLGSMAVQGPVMRWVADHRKHHAHADEEGDPHSPHVGHGDGAARRAARALARPRRLAARPSRARPARASTRPTSTRTAACASSTATSRCSSSPASLLPALAGWALTGSLAGAATGLLWGGLVRIFLVHHITWSVNSVCHFLGTRRFETDDQSTQRVLARAALVRRVLAPQPPRLPALGRARPAPLGAGARPVGAADLGLEKLGLARNVVRITPSARRSASRRPRACTRPPATPS